MRLKFARHCLICYMQLCAFWHLSGQRRNLASRILVCVRFVGTMWRLHPQPRIHAVLKPLFVWRGCMEWIYSHGGIRATSCIFPSGIDIRAKSDDLRGLVNTYGDVASFCCINESMPPRIANLQNLPLLQRAKGVLWYVSTYLRRMTVSKCLRIWFHVFCVGQNGTCSLLSASFSRPASLIHASLSERE